VQPRSLAIFVMLAMAVCGCTTSQQPSVGSAATQAPAAGATGSAAAYASPEARIPGTTLSPNADYKISPLDVLDISVFQVPDLSKTVQVSSSGQVTLALIGPVTAAGRSTTELEQDIAAKLAANYLQSPQVSVFVKEFTSQRITVDGAVLKPGIYPTTGRTTLIQAIALAGGLDRVADPNGIVVFREVAGKRTAAVFDMGLIRKGKKEDPVLQGGDVVVVDVSGVKAALRNVRESVGVIGLFSPLI
jgi:polysaccharide export outer membrane protein